MTSSNIGRGLLTKEGAVRSLIGEARSSRSSAASYRRTVKVLETLGLTSTEQLSILAMLDYTDKDGDIAARFLKGSKR